MHSSVERTAARLIKRIGTKERTRTIEVKHSTQSLASVKPLPLGSLFSLTLGSSTCLLVFIITAYIGFVFRRRMC